MAGNNIGWYGPLIDISDSPSHIGSYVQLLVYVHNCLPIQRYKASARGPILRTDIQVADDTGSYFRVCLWQKQMWSMVSAGDVVLLQNVKIQRLGLSVEAVTVYLSTMRVLAKSTQLVASVDMEEMLAHCQVGRPTKEKLKQVVQYVQQIGFTFDRNQANSRMMIQGIKNWTTPVERNQRHCASISEISNIKECCNVTFFGNVSEILLLSKLQCGEEFNAEKLFISKRLFAIDNGKLAEDLICFGCKVCGYTAESRCFIEQETDFHCCGKGSNHLHNLGYIFRPYLLYVWDASDHVPLLVKNRAAEMLFGNITAENVYRCYQTNSSPDYFAIWLILLKLLLQQNKNSPLEFEVSVSHGLDKKKDEIELVHVKMPCYKINKLFA